MALRRVATTRIDDVRPLGDYGQRSFEFITGVLERELTERHANLFAEPEDLAGGVAWMTPVSGDILALEDLDENEGMALRSDLGELFDDILALADRYQGSRDPAAQSLAIALRNAVEVPNEECIFRVGTQPVIVQWAHHLDVFNPPRGVLSRIVKWTPATPVPPAAAADDAEETSEPITVVTRPQLVAATTPAYLDWLWWLGWLLLAILLVWFIASALPACGVTIFWPFDRCARAETRSVEIFDDTADLEREIGDLERRIADSERQCVAQADPQESRPSEETTIEETTIEDVIREQDTSKLEGCWDLESDYTLYEVQTNRPISVNEWEICFDGEGGGNQTLIFSDGTECKGPVIASFDDNGRLTVLDDGNVACMAGVRAGTFIHQRRTQCDLSQEHTAQCQSTDARDDPTMGGAEVIFRPSHQ